MPKEVRKRLTARIWLVAAMWLAIAASSAYAARGVRYFLMTDPRFALRGPESGSARNQGVSISGAQYTPDRSVRRVFADDYGRSIFDINIQERRRRLLAIDWVQDASVSRVLPNRILVRLKERVPVAYVNVPHRSFLLVDGDGVLLTPPPRATFNFPVLDGVTTGQTEPERKVRVQAAMRLLDELGPAAKDVSEISAYSLEDLRVVTAMQGRAVELWLGAENFGPRYRNFAEHYADIHTSSPNASTFDLRIDDRITAK